MNQWYRRTLYYLVTLFVVIIAYAGAYDYGMTAFEGRSQNFLHSLQIVVETFTTTGFGSDAPWSSWQMNVLVIVMDLTGVFLIFLALPVLVFPLFEEALSTTVPTSVTGYEDHVVICSYTARADALIDELDSWDVEHVLIEPDRDTATDLYENDYDVIHEDPTSVSGLENADLGSARAVVADLSDEVDTSIVLTAQEVSEDVRIVSVVEEPSHRRYHELAGADVVLSPRPLLGASLASKVTTSFRTDVSDAVDISSDLQIAEIPIRSNSPLEGTTLLDSDLREETGVNVIGAWMQGTFESPPDPTATLRRGSVLLVAGRPDQLAALRDLTLSEIRRYDGGHVLLAGHGEVGKRVAERLDDEEIPYTVVDIVDKEGVDVVGDVTDPATLEAAEVHGIRTVLLAIPDDTAAEFATLVVRDLSPETEIIARTEEAESVQKMYRAGADYVLSLETVTGRMIASAILEDEEVMSVDTQVDVVRTTAPELVGQSVGSADVRARTGCTIVAVERDGETHTDLDVNFRIREGDELVIAGTDEGTNRFMDAFR
ncbi:potassium channel family protein [Halapricum salinum]|uniref:TrkA family potassium uptake protein n=1 Tax=Halapricum salinum TaxID=1457250 RepID=A0A4D6HEI7_9EURY|nr:NAD-binding protein [Halapricum salinum]QCC52363.1 TrkA family potassium uptake protein [Halapricum salinum]